MAHDKTLHKNIIKTLKNVENVNKIVVYLPRLKINIETHTKTPNGDSTMKCRHNMQRYANIMHSLIREGAVSPTWRIPQTEVVWFPRRDDEEKHAHSDSNHRVGDVSANQHRSMLTQLTDALFPKTFQQFPCVTSSMTSPPSRTHKLVTQKQL